MFIGGKQEDGPTGGGYIVEIELHGEIVPSRLNVAEPNIPSLPTMTMVRSTTSGMVNVMTPSLGVCSS
jgi:hypothetical protein